MILLPYTDLEGGRIFAERVRAAIEKNTFSTVSRVTCSFGVAQLALEEMETLLDRADEALYEAKEGGRNAVRAAPDRPQPDM